MRRNDLLMYVLTTMLRAPNEHCVETNRQTDFYPGCDMGWHLLAACAFALRTQFQYSHNRRFLANDILLAFAMLVDVILSTL